MHEGEHAKQEEGVKNGVDTKEMNECHLNFLINPKDIKDNNVIYASEDPVLYKMQPAEYYAFFNSEDMTRRVFRILQAKFGLDEGFIKWDKSTGKNNFEALARKWNIDNNYKELSGGVELTVTALRKRVINAMLENFIKWYNLSGEVEACKILNLNYRDYRPKIKDDWIIDSNEIGKQEN